MTEASSSSLFQQRVWAGRIPVVFSLDPNEVTTLHAPRPFYAMVPRMSYLISQTRDVVEYFRDSAPPMSVMQGASIWFEAKGVPLHWHLPFGLLRDLLCGPSAHDDALDLPWALTVHFLDYPKDALIPCENEQIIESHFMHSLKQSTFLRMGSTKTVMALPEAQQNQIWTSITKSTQRNSLKIIKFLYSDQLASRRWLWKISASNTRVAIRWRRKHLGITAFAISSASWPCTCNPDADRSLTRWYNYVI